MNFDKFVFRKKMFFFISCLVFCSFILLLHFNDKLVPIVISYGKYECENIMIQLTNNVVKENLNQNIREKIIKYDEDTMVIDLNSEVLSSISINTINKLQKRISDIQNGDYDYLSKIGVTSSNISLNEGIVYEVPVSRILNNPFMVNLGSKVPVRYQLIGKINGSIDSRIKEYGINNALLEITLIVQVKTKIISPLLSEEENLNISVPLIYKIIQGRVPELIFDGNMIGGN